LGQCYGLAATKKIKGLHENDFIMATRSTAYSLTRPQGERVLLVPQQAAHARLGASSLRTVLQMVASGYGVTLPEVAIDVEVRDE
jgi:DNA-binding transcriptional LysR family regulator